VSLRLTGERRVDGRKALQAGVLEGAAEVAGRAASGFIVF